MTIIIIIIQVRFEATGAVIIKGLRGGAQNGAPEELREGIGCTPVGPKPK